MIKRSGLVYDREILIGDEVVVNFDGTRTITGILRFYYPQDGIWVIDETGVAVHYVNDYQTISKLVTP
jgi:hypothetical protein